MRQAPRISMSEMCLGALLKPAGDHELVIEVPSAIVGVKLTRDQVDQLERGIAEWRTEVVRADAGPDFHKPRFKPLEVKR